MFILLKSREQTSQGSPQFSLFFLGRLVRVDVRGSLISIIQVVSSNLTIRLKSRKKLITTAVFWGALLWLPTFFLPIYAGENRVLVFPDQNV